MADAYNAVQDSVSTLLEAVLRMIPNAQRILDKDVINAFLGICSMFRDTVFERLLSVKF